MTVLQCVGMAKLGSLVVQTTAIEPQKNSGCPNSRTTIGMRIGWTIIVRKD